MFWRTQIIYYFNFENKVKTLIPWKPARETLSFLQLLGKALGAQCTGPAGVPCQPVRAQMSPLLGGLTQQMPGPFPADGGHAPGDVQGKGTLVTRPGCGLPGLFLPVAS